MYKELENFVNVKKNIIKIMKKYEGFEKRMIAIMEKNL